MPPSDVSGSKSRALSRGICFASASEVRSDSPVVEVGLNRLAEENLYRHGVFRLCVMGLLLGAFVSILLIGVHLWAKTLPPPPRSCGHVRTFIPVAARDVPSGTVLGPDDVKDVELTHCAGTFLAGSFDASKLVLHRRIRYSLLKDEVIKVAVFKSFVDGSWSPEDEAEMTYSVCMNADGLYACEPLELWCEFFPTGNSGRP